jgi:DNA-binding MarR family transcriptional regulator
MSKKIEEQQLQTIINLGRLFSDTTILMHEAIARRAGLTGTDHKYLGLLIQRGAMTAGELSKITGLTTGAVTGLIDRLEKKKLVRREFDKTDRRKIIIVPNTENAAKLLGPTFSDLQSKIVNYISTLSDNEKLIIEKYLLSTIDIMNEVTNKIK